MPQPSARHANTRTISSTGTRLPEKIVPCVSSTYPSHWLQYSCRQRPPGMTIRTAIAESRPALIRTVRIGAEMLRGVHLARAAPVGGARRGWDRRRRGRRFLRRRLTGGTVGFSGEARERRPVVGGRGGGGRQP